MKDGYTHISIILDRTGSMESIRDDTIGGFNTFLEEQKKQPGMATLTLVQFDSQDSYEVIHDFKPVDEILPLTRETYVPRASTPGGPFTPFRSKKGVLRHSNRFANSRPG
jgi:hypothetical protein